MATSPTPFIEQIEGRYGVIRFFSKDTVIGTALRTYGEWAENELRLFRHFIPAGATVLDVGAFIGTHALAFSQMVGPGARFCRSSRKPVPSRYWKRMCTRTGATTFGFTVPPSVPNPVASSWSQWTSATASISAA